MPARDLHSVPFDAGTIAKLEMFQDYTETWLPVFIMLGNQELHIFDFFAGSGYDSAEVPGSPIRILESILKFKGDLFSRKAKVVVHLNEFEPGKKRQAKYNKLVQSCDAFKEREPGVFHRVHINYYNKSFDTLFFELLPFIRDYPSLVFLDQNGIKFLSAKYLLELERMSQTDFLYFVSSSYFWRFGGRSEFRGHVDIDMDWVKAQGYVNVHRSITQQLRQKLPADTKLRLFPFSFVKEPNIYGIIFGASHLLAFDKFLSISWKKNKDNGDANRDIDGDSAKQLSLFEDVGVSKIERFKAEVKRKLLDGEITTNAELLYFCYSAGHIPAHAADVAKELKRSKLLEYEGKSPLVTYDNISEKRIIEYRITS